MAKCRDQITKNQQKQINRHTNRIRLLENEVRELKDTVEFVLRQNQNHINDRNNPHMNIGAQVVNLSRWDLIKQLLGIKRWELKYATPKRAKHTHPQTR